MKKTMMIFGLLLPLLTFAENASTYPIEVPKVSPDTVKHSEGYVSFGIGPVPAPLPNFGIGGRFQDGHNGADFSVQVATLGSAFTALKENASYLYYFKPNLASQFYVGGGLSLTELFAKGSHGFNGILSPELTFGKEYINEAGDRKFFQLQVDFPNVYVGKDRKYSGRTNFFPVCILSYGICF